MKFDQLEKVRKKQSFKFRLFLSLGVIALFIFAWAIIQFQNHINIKNLSYFYTVTLSLAIAILFMILANKAYKKFESSVKQALLNDILVKEFVEFDYKINKFIPKNVIVEAGLFQRPIRVSGEDYLKGKYKNITFEVSDIKLEESSGDSTNTYFKGRWFVFTLNKNFQETIKLVDGYKAYIDKKGLTEVETESTVFNKRFHMYTSNIKFFYQLMTPSYIEVINNLTEKIKGKTSFALIDNKFIVAINDRSNFLRINLNKEIKAEIVTELRNELIQIKELIEKLGLTENEFN